MDHTLWGYGKLQQLKTENSMTDLKLLTSIILAHMWRSILASRSASMYALRLLVASNAAQQFLPIAVHIHAAGHSIALAELLTWAAAAVCKADGSNAGFLLDGRLRDGNFLA